MNPDGSEKWHFVIPGDDAVWSSAAVCADGTVYFDTWNTLYALNPDGTLKWQWQCLAWEGPSSPTVGSDGTVYFGANGIYALTGSSPLANSSWPKYQHDVRNSGWAGAK